jgi:carboxylesterase type B
MALMENYRLQRNFFHHLPISDECPLKSRHASFDNFVAMTARSAVVSLFHSSNESLGDEPALVAVAAHNGTSYTYLFDWAPPASRFRSCHVIEMPFVFGTYDTYHDAPMMAGGDPQQIADLSTAVRSAWISFIRDGTPEHSLVPSWPAYDVIHRPTMRLGARIGIIDLASG